MSMTMPTNVPTNCGMFNPEFALHEPEGCSREESYKTVSRHGWYKVVDISTSFYPLGMIYISIESQEAYLSNTLWFILI